MTRHLRQLTAVRASSSARGGRRWISVRSGGWARQWRGPVRRSLAQIAAGFGISVGTAHAYTAAVIDLLAARAPGLFKVLREHAPEYALLDGTLAECDRVGDGRADYSHQHRRHGVNVQVVTDPAVRVLWISPALPGRCHDLTAARTTGSSGSANARAWPFWPTAPTRAPAPGSPPGADGRPAGS